MSDNSSIGARMEQYEEPTNHRLIRRIPSIIRLDGQAFHNWTKKLNKPVDRDFEDCMFYAASQLCKKIDGVRFAYHQSDEISLLLVDYQSRNSEAWFDYRLQKICSISAALCTAAFNHAANILLADNYKQKGFACFDSRVYSIPPHEVCNYFIWRQQDATRNSIQSNGRAFFSHKELLNKDCNQIQDMLFKKHNLNWNDLPTSRKRGSALFKVERTVNGAVRKQWVIDINMPIILQNKAYVNKWVKPEPVYPKRFKISFLDLKEYHPFKWSL